MITIVEYNAGNPTSVQRALTAVGVPSRITGNAQEVADAERVIFPGVGHAGSTMQVLRERKLDGALASVARRGVPLLGICVGGQLMLETSEESNANCLGFFSGSVQRFSPQLADLKIPHMGWNRIAVRHDASEKPHPIFEKLPTNNEVYFVHSYFMAPSLPSCVIGTTTHGVEFASAMADRNLIALQFHPEKSGPLGLAILAQFAQWQPQGNPWQPIKQQAEGAPC